MIQGCCKNHFQIASHIFQLSIEIKLAGLGWWFGVGGKAFFFWFKKTLLILDNYCSPPKKTTWKTARSDDVP